MRHDIIERLESLSFETTPDLTALQRKGARRRRRRHICSAVAITAVLVGIGIGPLLSLQPLTPRIDGLSTGNADVTLGCPAQDDETWHCIPEDQQVMVPDARLPGLGGHDTAVRPLLGGSVTIVSVIGSWCAPCRTQQADINVVLAEHPSIRLVTIFAVSDGVQSKAFVDEFGVGGAALLDPEGDYTQRLLRAVGAEESGVPATFLADAEGRIAAWTMGATTHAQINRVLRPARHK